MHENRLTWDAFYWKTPITAYNYTKASIDYSGQYSKDEFYQAMQIMYKEYDIHDTQRMKREFTKWKYKWIFEGLVSVDAYDWEIPPELCHNPIMRIV